MTGAILAREDSAMDSRPVREVVEESQRLREEARALIAEARRASEECERLLLATEEEGRRARAGRERGDGPPE